MLELILTEYIKIVSHLEENNKIENNRIVIDKDYFKDLLEKYQYLTFSKKTKIYKSLNLIIHDKNNYTMPYRDKELKKTVRKVIINYDTYKILKEIMSIKVVK
jgi:hypothetical protein